MAISPRQAIDPNVDGERASWHKLGLLPALDFWINTVQALLENTEDAKRPPMEAAGKAQLELEKIEKQIEELETAAGDNQEAHRQLSALHERINNLRRQVTAAMGAWQRTE